MYLPNWINRLEQFGYITYELLIEDDEEIMPPAKQEYKFYSEPSLEKMKSIEDEFIKQTEEIWQPPL